MATNDNNSDSVDPMEEDCPLCCETFDSKCGRSKVTCSAENGCSTFTMCRLCVYQQSMQLNQPFVVDENSGDFVTLDPTSCPQCKRPGAFREDQLPPLSDEMKKAVEDETRDRRYEATQRQRDQALRLLESAPYVALGSGHSTQVADRPTHERIKIINGNQLGITVNHFIADAGVHSDEFIFRDNATLGVPDMLSALSGILYYEIEIEGRGLWTDPGIEPICKFGFSVAEGLRVSNNGHPQNNGTVGDNAKSWGFCGFTGYKIHVGDAIGDGSTRARGWGPGTVVGIAANLDKGMIAVSTNGNWEIVHGNGVKFEDEAIKSGVYPCISGSAICPPLVCRLSDFKQGLPPPSLWETWPRYEDVTWLGLTEEARAAAIVLGYTQQSWVGSSSSNPIENREWCELSDMEKEAAITLGYNADIWSQITQLWRCDVVDDESSGSDSDSEDESLTSPFESMSWEELPGDARRAAETLGYTERSWNEDDDGPLDDKTWSELTQTQKNAAIVLGYDEDSWDADSESDGDSVDSDSSASTENGGLPFDHLHWSELPNNAREAAEKLGHSAETWDQNLKSSWDNTPYEELPMEQQFAATILGYSADKWNREINEALDLASILFLGQPRQR